MNSINTGTMNPMKQSVARRGGARSFSDGIVALAALVTMSACEVTNPGPVQDEFLGLPESQQALVNGAGRRLVEAINNLGYTGALPAREIFPGGQTGAHGHDVIVQGGFLTPGGFGGHFNVAQQARFIAEDAIGRFTAEGVEAPAEILTQAYTWAGYANRVLGENWCEAVIDGSALMPGITYFERAEEHFNQAIANAPDEESRAVATAGRAQVRLWLEKFTEAAADASTIPTGWEFSLNMDVVDPDTRNMIYWAVANQPYRAYTVKYTFFENYYSDTGDPRTPWGTLAGVQYANASLSGHGQVLFIQEQKYTGPSDDVRLASGREMRLIEAEVLLQQGQWQAALDKINNMRATVISSTTGQPLEPWTANSLEATWTVLKRERGVELWLEARRLGDQRRWIENNTPGDLELPDFEAQSPLFSQNPRSLCFDIPDSERDANPNVPGRNTGT